MHDTAPVGRLHAAVDLDVHVGEGEHAVGDIELEHEHLAGEGEIDLGAGCSGGHGVIQGCETSGIADGFVCGGDKHGGVPQFFLIFFILSSLFFAGQSELPVRGMGDKLIVWER